LNLYCRYGALFGGLSAILLGLGRNGIGFDPGLIVIAHLKDLRTYLRAEAATDTEVFVYHGSFHFDVSLARAAPATQRRANPPAKHNPNNILLSFCCGKSLEQLRIMGQIANLPCYWQVSNLPHVPPKYLWPLIAFNYTPSCKGRLDPNQGCPGLESK